MKDPLIGFGRPVRPWAALAWAVFVAYWFRISELGMGEDEFSLLAMAAAMRDGALPYAEYWDVRLPLAYLWGLPSAFLESDAAAPALLRVLAWLSQAVAAWAFFCMLQRSLGMAGALVGAVALLSVANRTNLHAMAMPNHFSMTMSVMAFALLVAGLRGRRRIDGMAYGASALLAGMLPWTMMHASLVSASLAVMAWCGGAADEAGRRPSGRWAWLAIFAAPTLILAALYAAWGPADVLVRTLIAPALLLDLRSQSGGYEPFSGEDAWEVLAAFPWAPAQLLLLCAGAAWLLGAVRRAPQGSPLRLMMFLAAPIVAGFAVMSYAKPPAPPEYLIDMAPVLALLAAVAASRIMRWPGWAKWRMTRRMDGDVRNALAAAGLAGLLVLPMDPWMSGQSVRHPENFCRDVAGHWAGRLGPQDTVLNLLGVCSLQVLESEAAPHPPFTFGPLWLWHLEHVWIGYVLEADAGAGAAADRLKRALSHSSSAALILADDEFLQTVRDQGWDRWFFEEWRMVWRSRRQGDEAEKSLGSLVVLVRRAPAAGDLSAP